jgi:hypothetical protein
MMKKERNTMRISKKKKTSTACLHSPKWKKKNDCCRYYVVGGEKKNKNKSDITSLVFVFRLAREELDGDWLAPQVRATRARDRDRA